MAGSSSNSPLSDPINTPLHTLLHLITIKLSSTNYLLWKNQVHPVLSYLNLLSHIDGTSQSPPESVTSDGKTSPNPEFITWKQKDQRVLLLLHSTLTEEVMAEAIGHTSAHQVWRALEHAYGHHSVERMHTLRDGLRQLQKGTSSVSDFGRRFKSLCDQLAAIGHPVSDEDKRHWFLCGLGSSFETFSTAQRMVHPSPPFRDILDQATNHEIFLQTINTSNTPQAAFSAYSNRPSQKQPSQSSRSRFRGSSSTHGRSSHNKRPPHCQLCRKDGHYASACPNLASYAQRATPLDAHLAQAFNAQCNINPDWTADSGATTHMLRSTNALNEAHNDAGNTFVTFGNGQSLPVSQIGNSKLNDIPLKNVLVVPNLTRNLLSISRLTNDAPVDVLFSNSFFQIQDRKTAAVLARGTCENGFYVLSQSHKSLVASLAVPHLRASFDKWHSRLGHVSFDVISILNKLGQVFVTSLLPKPGLCASCQLSKAKRLPFVENNKRSSRVLDLVHCDLWGPSPIPSTDGYLYYVVFVDDFSRFTWLYPLKFKSDFYNILVTFLNFVHNQFECNVKIFQSDGGTEFTNNRVQSLFQQHGIFHRLSCPHTPQQNGRAERKHRHITEMGLAMMFNSHCPAQFWLDAFTSATYIINRLPTPILQNKSPFEMLFHRPPSYSNFRVFGCRVFPFLRDYTKHKLLPRSEPCIFIGYSPKYKGYRCLDPITSRIYMTRHAKFDEENFPFSGHVSTVDVEKLLISNFDENIPSPESQLTSPQPTPKHNSSSFDSPHRCTICPTHDISPSPLPQTHRSSPSPNNDISPLPSFPTTPALSTPPGPTNLPPNSPASNLQHPHISLPTQSPTLNPNPINTQPSSSTSTHPMHTRSKSGIFKPKHFANLTDFSRNQLHHALFTSQVPKSIKTASKDSHWVTAMHDELTALRNNDTWDLVQRPAHLNVVGSKWIYRIKYKADGSVDRYKARLVAQGFTQVPGLDFFHTFSPVVKASTIRFTWNNHRVSSTRNSRIMCVVSNVLSMDSSKHPVLGFKDDIIITGNNQDVIKTFTECLHKEFKIKDLGKLNYFLGLEVISNSSGLFLSQSKYAYDILSRAGLLDPKPVGTPLNTTDTFSSSGTPFHDPTFIDL
ncbi:putative RNA-directed DNA polymerase [Helianthus annuus]|nr:putative RNA-directed DNA polymerase [Helianthus annuus]KAJ0506591.1 putative RNA-directed DNA polymerase [Helianthus annuus]KAJ0676266.1 putative RNA-directed DNA polymerase [Helianthus annuus]KAJ0679493.1 putative RNA-directed DNA polymerase [Helianthus annuus]